MARELRHRKIFMTGVTGSGKTTFARKYSQEQGLPYLDFDALFDYAQAENQSRRMLSRLPDAFVIDAIPIDERGTWRDFLEFESQHEDVVVICMYCPDRTEWLQRLRRKDIDERKKMKWRSRLKATVCELSQARRDESVRNAVAKCSGLWRKVLGAMFLLTHYRRILSAQNREKHLAAYRHFHVRTGEAIAGFRNVLYYDSSVGEYTSRETLQERVQIDRLALEWRLWNPKEGYDSRYQDVEILGFVGYSESHKTWNRISGLVEWKGQRVVDVGCNHGYFAFKAEDQGASAIGLDQSAEVLETARLINRARKGHVEFLEWTDREEFPPRDILLCLNVLHHFADPPGVLDRMKRFGQVILEINEEQLPLVNEHLHVTRSVPSHRNGRRILLCEGGGESSN